MSSLITERLTPSENRVTLGCFEVAGGLYALDVSQLREVVRWQPVTPLPKAPSLIEGVIDLRGAIVPVVDLGRALSGKPLETRDSTRVAVVEIDGLVMGLVVDAAIEVVSIESTCIDDPPGLATQAGYDMTRAVVRRPNDRPILVLSLEHLLESVYRSTLHASEGRS
ncbi:MAG: chemotaxis protein CheW [Myxococcales bacterium]|nr:chemotaxis protein CheW [Myxococcales bacterium]